MDQYCTITRKRSFSASIGYMRFDSESSKRRNVSQCNNSPRHCSEINLFTDPKKQIFVHRTSRIEEVGGGGGGGGEKCMKDVFIGTLRGDGSTRGSKNNDNAIVRLVESKVIVLIAVPEPSSRQSSTAAQVPYGRLCDMNRCDIKETNHAICDIIPAAAVVGTTTDVPTSVQVQRLQEKSCSQHNSSELCSTSFEQNHLRCNEVTPPSMPMSFLISYVLGNELQNDCDTSIGRSDKQSSLHRWKMDEGRSYYIAVICDCIRNFVSDMIIRNVARNFMTEALMGIQSRRSNCIGVAPIVFKIGEKLHHNGYFCSAMKLYDDLLHRLIYGTKFVSRCCTTSTNAPTLLIQQEPVEPNIASVLPQQSRGETITNNLLSQIQPPFCTESWNEFLCVYPWMASTLQRLGSIHLQMNDFDMAMKCLNAENKVNDAKYNVSHSVIVDTLLNMALVHRHRNHFSLALLKYIQVYFLQLRVYGPNSIQVANVLSMIALMQYRLKQFSSAFELYLETLTIQREIHGERNIGVASTINSLGLCCFYLQMLPYAKKFFSRSLQIRQSIVGKDHIDLAILWYNLATIYVDQNDEIDAIRCYKESLRIELIANTTSCTPSSIRGSNNVDGTCLCLQSLGYIYQRNGELDEAQYYFTKAIQFVQQKKTISISNFELLAKLYNLLGNIHLQKAEVKEMMNCYIQAARIHQQQNQSPPNASSSSSSRSTTTSSDPFETMIISGFTFYAISKPHPQCAALA